MGSEGEEGKGWQQKRNTNGNEDNCWYHQLKEAQWCAAHCKNNKIVSFSKRARAGFPLTILCFSARVSLMFLHVCPPVSRRCGICQTWSGRSGGAAIRNCLAGVVMCRSFLLSPSRELWDNQQAAHTFVVELVVDGVVTRILQSIELHRNTGIVVAASGISKWWIWLTRQDVQFQSSLPCLNLFRWIVC